MKTSYIACLAGAFILAGMPISVFGQTFPIAQLDGRFVITIPAGQYTITKADGSKTVSFLLPTSKDGKMPPLGPNGMPVVPKDGVIETPVEISVRNGRIVGCLVGKEPAKNTSSCTIANNQLLITSTVDEGQGKGISRSFRFNLNNNLPLKGSYTLTQPNMTNGPSNYGEIATLRRL